MALAVYANVSRDEIIRLRLQPRINGSASEKRYSKHEEDPQAQALPGANDDNQATIAQ
jgi:hypothetical protein